jgi:hypothetical protein
MNVFMCPAQSPPQLPHTVPRPQLTFAKRCVECICRGCGLPLEWQLPEHRQDNACYIVAVSETRFLLLTHWRLRFPQGPFSHFIAGWGKNLVPSDLLVLFLARSECKHQPTLLRTPLQVTFAYHSIPMSRIELLEQIRLGRDFLSAPECFDERDAFLPPARGLFFDIAQRYADLGSGSSNGC